MERGASTDAAEDLEDLYENAPCGYLSLRPDGSIVKANATLAAWTGYSQEQLLGKRLLDLLNVPGKIFYETHFAPLLRMQGFFHEVALDIITSEGQRLPVLANAVERRGPSGNLVFTRLTIFQAVQRRRYERELADARTLAEKGLMEEREMGELREQFIAVLGHDLRNPLAAIASGVRILQRTPDHTERTRILDLMQGSVGRMSILIDNVLDFARSRLGGGLSVVRSTEPPLDAALRQVVAELQTAVPDRVLDTDIDLSNPVWCDSARIAQLASNLLANAMTHGSEEEPVRFRARIAGDHFELVVSNGGDPIPPETMEHLFQPFFRGNIRPSAQGLGLGLHIASEIAKAHRGTLTATSTSVETCLTFRMPLSC
jgi:phosphoserine phosphatase RsbU/P